MSKRQDWSNDSKEQRIKKEASQRKQLGSTEDKKLHGPNRPST